MSRYVKVLSDTVTVAYGIDHALGYFFQVYDPETDVSVIDECTAFTSLSKGRMVELMTEYGASTEHIQLVAFDMPF